MWQNQTYNFAKLSKFLTGCNFVNLFQRTIERLSSASPRVSSQHASTGRELSVSSLPDVNQSDKRIETNLLNLGTGSYLPVSLIFFYHIEEWARKFVKNSPILLNTTEVFL